MAWGGVLALSIGTALAWQGAALAANAPKADAAPGSCATVLRPLEAGSIPAKADFVTAACVVRSSFPFRYDRSIRAMRAVRNVGEGETVGAIPAFALPAIRPGEVLILSTQIGPVTVERRVEAVQAAFPGEALYVKAADGSLFVAPFPESKP